MQTLEELIHLLEQKEILKTPAIITAFRKVDRSKFVLPEQTAWTYQDRALPIIEGQTISQPSTVAFMLEMLDPQHQEKILDVGSGSGWTTALLAEIVGTRGKVFAMERIKNLKEFGERNVRKLHYQNVTFKEDDGAFGWPEHAPFDRILVSASAKEIPLSLKEQLRPGGKMVIPLVNMDKPYGRLILLKKITEKEFEEQQFPGFNFVPFIMD